jgi:crossover junction endodeoxyribonuclease RuvC
MILGIDPGISGGWACIDHDGQLLHWSRTPTLHLRNKRIVDSRRLYEPLRDLDLDHAIIEQVHAMPRQGVSSSFSFGRSTGAVEAVALIVAPTAHWVTPSVWKGALGLSSSKQASLDAARLKFGDRGKLWDVKANDGIAEAALLAWYWLDKSKK